MATQEQLNDRAALLRAIEACETPFRRLRHLEGVTATGIMCLEIHVNNPERELPISIAQILLLHQALDTYPTVYLSANIWRALEHFPVPPGKPPILVTP